MSATWITVSGCDDQTTVDLDLTDEQFATAQLIAEAVTQASTFGCMPTMKVGRRP